MDAIVVNEKDNVAVVLRNVKPCEKIVVLMGDKTLEIVAKDFVKRGHKIALKDIRCGDSIVKYGEVIGIATKDIKRGQHVHVHNVKSARIGE